KKNNWWGPAGATGPCGPDIEIFYWGGAANQVPGSFNDDNEAWIEIWNNVFMQYNKNAAGKFEPLAQKNVDTGLGLERVLAVINGLDDNYQTDLFSHIIEQIEKESGHKYGENIEITRMMRIIADHLKAATFIIGDNRGVTPSNTDQGYVVRRLIRRAILQGKKIGISVYNPTWPSYIAYIIANDYSHVYPEIRNNLGFISSELTSEALKFQKTLEKGLIEFNKLATGGISGEEAFNLYQSYGFPLEITEELAKEKGVTIDRAGFAVELQKHQSLSRTASVGKFKGGLADAGEATTKLHTAAHLLLAALRRVLGDHVTQKGSNITPERLRLDFSHPEKVTPAQIKQVEDLVNGVIKNDFKVICEELSLEEAKKRGAMGVFDSKYGEKVKVYTVCHLGEGNKLAPECLKSAFSQEICGGPHVASTEILGHFSIVKEEASSAGVRRIKAVLTK
ncbi:MAG: alanine--tRNA ligase, partial [bacterium]|nr:alanine--tRNA ligase [bacterium]